MTAYRQSLLRLSVYFAFIVDVLVHILGHVTLSMQETALRLAAIAENEERFQKFAEAQMQHWDTTGKNTLPARIFLNSRDRAKGSLAGLS